MHKEEVALSHTLMIKWEKLEVFETSFQKNSWRGTFSSKFPFDFRRKCNNLDSKISSENSLALTGMGLELWAFGDWMTGDLAKNKQK